MNTVKKTTLWDRLKNAARAFRGKPANHLTMNLGIRRCDQCDRGDCGQCLYKQEFNRLMNLRNCHDCKYSGPDNPCGVCPKLGEEVRINCFLWEPRAAEKKEVTEG